MDWGVSGTVRVWLSQEGGVGLNARILMRQAECMSASAASDFVSTVVCHQHRLDAAMFAVKLDIVAGALRTWRDLR